MSILLLGGDGGEIPIEIAATSYTESYGTAVLFVEGAALLASVTEFYGTCAIVMVSAAPGVSQAWIAQG